MERLKKFPSVENWELAWKECWYITTIQRLNMSCFVCVALGPLNHWLMAAQVFNALLRNEADVVLTVYAHTHTYRDILSDVHADVVYTPYLNLKKEERMEVGQVGFKECRVTTYTKT
eukprot:5140551-Amphidinium_carterae.1